MAKKFNFTEAANSVKSVCNKSHTGFKKANTVVKKIDQGAQYLNKNANMVNDIAAIHKERRVRKVNSYIQTGHAFAQSKQTYSSWNESS